MRAIRVSAFGGPNVLDYTTVEQPTPAPGEALVRVAAVGVNFTDILQRAGRRPGQTLPFTPGAEASGVIERVGAGVAELRPGDRVMHAMGPNGTYAEYVAVPSKLLIRLPAEIDLVRAAAVPLQALTAQYLLHDFRPVGPDTIVLVHAVAGGVGLLLAQWAAHLGAHVIGTTSSAEKAALARAAGARDVIVYTEQDFVAAVKFATNGRGADFVLDSVGRTTFPGDLEAVADRGHIVIFGQAGGQVEPFGPNAALTGRSLTVSGANLGSFMTTREEIVRRADQVLDAVKTGWLRTSIQHVLPLAQAAEAHTLLESRATSGKLLLTP